MVAGVSEVRQRHAFAKLRQDLLHVANQSLAPCLPQGRFCSVGFITLRCASAPARYAISLLTRGSARRGAVLPSPAHVPRALVALCRRPLTTSLCTRTHVRVRSRERACLGGLRWPSEGNAGSEVATMYSVQQALCSLAVTSKQQSTGPLHEAYITMPRLVSYSLPPWALVARWPRAPWPRP